jgi:hypothetical protein
VHWRRVHRRIDSIRNLRLTRVTVKLASIYVSLLYLVRVADISPGAGRLGM